MTGPLGDTKYARKLATARLSLLPAPGCWAKVSSDLRARV